MKVLSTIVMLALLQFISIISVAQSNSNNNIHKPLNPVEAGFYGQDVLIQPNSSEDQSGVRISCAFNGWLYSAYIISSGGFRVARSVDNGLTWTYSGLLRSDLYLVSMDMTVTGTDVGNLKVWIVNSGFTKLNIDIWELSVEELNADLTTAGNTLLDQILSNSGFPGVAIASDYKYPSAGASPFSIGVLYSKAGNARDSILFRSSGDGGITFGNHKPIAAMQSSLGGKVALAFGRSLSYPEGRYFAAWCEAPYWNPIGQIFTSYTASGFNSSWASPIRVDNIPQNASNNSKNPAIACQANNTDNGSIEFTAVILFDYLDLTTGKNRVAGVYSTSPVSSGNWQATRISGAAATLDFQPDITFDQDYNNFYTTWCDSTGQHLNCSYQSVDIPAPDSWMPFSTAYNDLPNLSAPYPRVAVNSAAQQLVNVWSGRISDMVGNATFDGENLFVSTPEVGGHGNNQEISIFPNPCQSSTTIGFQLKETSKFRMEVYNSHGQRVLNLPESTLAAGNHTIKLNIDNLESGLYIFKLISGSGEFNGKFTVVR